jgi:peptide/nickel transport system substrate-binding protein
VNQQGIITFPGVNGYTTDLDKRLPYDVDAAKKLLAGCRLSKWF